MTGHCKSAARWETFERRAGVCENDRSFSAVIVEFVSEHETSCLLTYQKGAERRVSKRFEHHDRVSFDKALAENAGNAAIDVMHNKPRRPDVSNDVLEEPLDGRRLACITGVSANAVHLLEALKDGFFRISGCDGDTHAIFGEEFGLAT